MPFWNRRKGKAEQVGSADTGQGAGAVSVDASFAGTIARDGTVSGTWWGNNDSGTFSGSKQ